MNAKPTREQRLAAALRDNLKRRKAASDVPAANGAVSNEDASAQPAERDGDGRDDDDEREDERSGR